MTRRVPLTRRRSALAAIAAAVMLIATPAQGARASARPATACMDPVSTAAGPVCGLQRADGREYLGIPYASPPTGERRFAPPAPPPRMASPYPAVAPGPHCVSPNIVAGPPSSESCLWLSVYLPADVTAHAKLPVMVWIHGGAFRFDDDSGNGIGTGTGSGQELANREHVAVVRVSYRLGALGFLAAGSSPGNLGLLDQRAALRWVARNIAAFGGDPANVTLFGQSAGATSVCLQLVAPESRGLFERAIIQSGFYQHFFSAASCSQRLPNRAQAQATARTLAARVGCMRSPIIACLRRVAASALLSASAGLNFTPIVDGRIVPVQPMTALRDGRFTHVPVMLGAARNEGLPTSVSTWSAFVAMVRGNYGASAPRVLAVYSPFSSPSPAVASGAVVSDQMVCSALATADGLARWVATYAYRYDDVTEPFYFTAPPTHGNILAGAYHSSELPALFPGWALPPAALLQTPDQLAIIDTVMGYWGAYARRGRPAPAGMAPWPRYRHDGRVMSLRPAYDSEMLSARDLRAAHHCRLWATIAP